MKQGANAPARIHYTTKSLDELTQVMTLALT
nr:MAG TPA_asm: hypothetical protein [Caudoviricetes sp.]